MATGATGFYTTQFLAPLLPVTGAFALPFAGYFGYLGLRVIRCRFSEHVEFGDNQWATYSPGGGNAGKASNKLADNELYKAVRAHQNFAENVPLAFAFAAIAELNGAHPTYLSCALGGLLAFRVLHVELGLYGPNAVGKGRPVGFLGTIGTIIGLAAYAGGLTYSFWMKQLE